MGNQNLSNKQTFDMHLTVIGADNNKLYELYEKSQILINIKKYWCFDKIEFTDFKTQINDYFSKYKKQDNKETLIIIVKNSSDPEIESIIKRIDKFGNKEYMPIVLFLTKEKEEKKDIKINWENYEEIEPRLIYIKNYTEDMKIFNKKIVPLLLRFCSIHNELGDRFTIGEGNYREDFDLTKNYFPFNLNIICVGRFGQGKSTGVNSLSQEYKAKESSKGCSQTKNLTFYHVKNKPIRILDIPGFENEKTINDVVKKVKFCSEEINKLKDNIHILLYFLNCNETKSFMDIEYPLLEEVIKHKSIKIIYVITHSNPGMNEKIRKKIYNRINTGIEGITLDKSIIKETLEFFGANQNNVVFVNFHKNQINNVEPFGKKELFKKIHDFFIDTEDYKKSLELLNPAAIEENVSKLKEQAKNILLSNKIWGGVVGIIPFVDWALQKFVIKNNAVKKVGRIFGIDVKFIDEEAEKNEKHDFMNLVNAESSFNMEIDGDELTNQTNNEIIGNSIKCTGEAGSIIGGGVSIGKGIIKASNAANMTIKATETVEKATKIAEMAAKYTAEATELSEKATEIVNNYNIVQKAFYWIVPSYNKAAQIAAKTSSLAVKAADIEARQTAIATNAANMVNKAANISNTANILKYSGTTLTIAGCLIGVATGAYFTYQFCEELIEKFVDFYTKNISKIRSSYQEAEKYFSLTDEKEVK